MACLCIKWLLLHGKPHHLPGGVRFGWVVGDVFVVLV
jgi:hypothetical protein